MTGWVPVSQEELSQDLSDGCQQMTEEQRRLWDLISFPPEKWAQHPWGDEGGGFWVVAIMGDHCLYYNDIEDGYNWSSYTTHGTIDEYWCDQDDLVQGANRIVRALQSQEPAPRLGAPRPIDRQPEW